MDQADLYLPPRHGEGALDKAFAFKMYTSDSHLDQVDQRVIQAARGAARRQPLLRGTSHAAGRPARGRAPRRRAAVDRPSATALVGASRRDAARNLAGRTADPLHEYTVRLYSIQASERRSFRRLHRLAALPLQPVKTARQGRPARPRTRSPAPCARPLCRHRPPCS